MRDDRSPRWAHDSPESDVLDDVIRPGRRFPHRWVDSAGTGQASTLDLVGSRWTLFAGPGDRRWPATSALGMNLHVHDLDAVDEAVLVRPDGFVAWRGTAEESLQETLRGLGLMRFRL
ncbi:hypothetical protein [Nonomuraea sp. NPDC049400]|uniref:aromatic-ring hydroxylase C-terminal domain-containing protein n=1 Tax=Nonomuraea sp. NPDC049400 TaxID=3364352 RepID=UPI0037B0DD99